MEIYVDYQLANGVRTRSSLDKKPDTCPVCGKGVDAILRIAFADSEYGELLQVILQCPRNECRSLMIAYYRRLDPLTRGRPDYRLIGVQPNNPTRRDFSEEIEKISPAFVNIYNQAYAAEQLQLDEISGVGYRKALEFLIKDYA